MMTDKMLRRRDVEARCGVKCSTLYDWMKAGHFPRPLALGPKAVGWRESDVNAWLESRTTKAS